MAVPATEIIRDPPRPKVRRPDVLPTFCKVITPGQPFPRRLRSQLPASHGLVRPIQLALGSEHAIAAETDHEQSQTIRGPDADAFVQRERFAIRIGVMLVADEPR